MVSHCGRSCRWLPRLTLAVCLLLTDALSCHNFAVDDHKLLDHLEGGGRLKQPAGCPVPVLDIMLTCWNKFPDVRPVCDDFCINDISSWISIIDIIILTEAAIAHLRQSFNSIIELLKKVPVSQQENFYEELSSLSFPLLSNQSILVQKPTNTSPTAPSMKSPVMSVEAHRQESMFMKPLWDLSTLTMRRSWRGETCSFTTQLLTNSSQVI